VERIVNENNKKVHYIIDAHTTLCGMTDEGVPGYAKPRWTRTDADVDCKLCLKRVPQG
jgi:hypothetical protein